MVVKQPGDRAARAVAKYGQRIVLGRDDRDRQLGVHLAGSAGGHQGEFVDRQRPRERSGDHERDVVQIAAFDVLDHSVEGVVEPPIVDRDGVRVAHVGASADREHEGVVVQPRRTLDVDEAPWLIDPGEAVGDQLGADVVRDLSELVPPRRSKRERFAHGHRPVDELAVGRDERDRNGLPGKRTECERRFQRGHASAGDDDVERSCRGVAGPIHAGEAMPRRS